MSLFSKWLAAGMLSTSLIFSGSFAEAKVKHPKSHKAHVKHKKSAKKQARKSSKHKKSESYAKAADYMKRSPASASTKVKVKKKARKHRRT